MLNSLASLFAAPKQRIAAKTAIRRGRQRQTAQSLAVQSLEPRLAMTVWAGFGPTGATAGSVVPLTGGGFAYNIVIDDQGTGQNAFLQRGFDGTDYVLLADNSGFNNPISLGMNLVNLGTCNTFFVTSGSREASATQVYGTAASSLTFTLPSVNPLGVSGRVSIGGGLSFDYSATALATGATANSVGTAPYVMTISLNGNWGAAGFGTPRGFLSNGTTLRFDFVDTANPAAAKNFTSASIFNDSYFYYLPGTKPQSFTAFAGQTFTQRLIADLQPVNSTVSINSPWLASQGSGTDQPLYSAYQGVFAAGQMTLYATNVNVNQTATTTSRFSVGSTDTRASGWNTPTPNISIAAPVAASNYAIEVTGSQVGTTTTHGTLLVSQTGSLTGSGGAAGSLTVTADYADIRFLGQVNANSQNYLLRAIGSQDQFDFTTRSAATGIATGLVSGSTLAMTLGQPAGGTIDLKTSVANLRYDAGVNASSIPYRYSVTVDEQSALQVDAVGASSGPISLKAAGDMTIVGSAIRTSGDISLAATGGLSIAGDVSTANGNVSLEAPTLTLGSVMTAGGTRGVTLVSRTGNTTANALTRAGGAVKQTVRVASIQDVALAGTTTIDGVTLANGDRVLLKNQNATTENGVYSYSSAGGGLLSRATDADTAAELPPGFVAFVLEGTQTGGWTLFNAATPILGQTGLQFVPVSAVRTYDEVKAATTAAITLSGTQTIDGVALVAGDRVLVKNQSNSAQNGLYVVSAGAWTRASDADSSAELTSGSFVFVQTGGTANGGKGFALNNDAIQVGTTPLSFVNFFTTASGSTSWAPARVLADAAVATTVDIDLTGLQTVDGIVLTGGERVLVKNQIIASENGVYVAAAGAWTRASDADLTGELPRGTAVYVTGGTQGANTSWQFNDSTQLLGTTTANSPNVTGLVSTTGLAVGMLVSGSGIPSGTTIASLGADGTSLRLSGNALTSVTGGVLSFVKTTSVAVETDPVVFVPVGGGIAITAAGSVGGSSRLQGSTALLTAGTGGGVGSSVNAQTNVGRISATAPGGIVLNNSNAVELENILTTAAGGVTVSADGTITALAVTATGTAGVAGDVSLTSIYGDVVAETITTNIGDIDLSSINGSVAVTTARRATANVAAATGNVAATADSSGAMITIDGRVSAQNAGGAAGVGDVNLFSNSGALKFSGNSVVTAADQLLISTPTSVPEVGTGAQITAARLNLTSEFGASTVPPTGLGSYQTVAISRTDAGNINLTSASDLTIETAATANGSISFTAPNLKVIGAIQPQGTNADLTLTATAGDLLVDAAIGSQRNVTLSATGGQVRGSAGGNTALVTAPADLTVNASGAARILTKAAGFTSTLTAASAVLAVTDADGLAIKSATLTNGGTATFDVGSAASGGGATIGKIDVGPTGSVTINAYGNIVEDTVDAGVADIVAGTATLLSTTGQITVDTDVDILSAGGQQKNRNIVINDVGISGLELKAPGGSNNANLSVTTLGTITATSVATTGTISLTATDPAADILVGQVSAPSNTVTLSAGRSILAVTPGDATPDVTGSAVTLTAGTGSIDVHLATSTVAATATTAGSSITLTDDDNLALAGITGKAVTVTAGSLITQTGAVVADSLSVASSGGSDITLLNAGNKFGTFSATSANGGTVGSIQVLDSDADLVLGAITGGPVAITSTGTGPITQATGTAISATKLTVTNTAGAVTLGNAGNDATSIQITNAAGAVTYADKSGFDVVGIVGTAITLSAAGDITQSGAVRGGGSLAVTSTAGAVSLGRNDNESATVSIVNTGRAITYRDATGFDIGAGGLSGGAVTLTGNGNLTQTGSIVATSLTVTTAAGSINFQNLSNDVDQFSGTDIGGQIYFRDADDLQISSLNTGAGAAVLIVGGALGQTGGITSGSLDVYGSGGDVSLGRSDNEITTIGIRNGAGGITYRDATGFGVSAIGMRGGSVTLTGNGYLTQPLTAGSEIVATSLAVTTAAGSINFQNASNDVDQFSGTDIGGQIYFRDADGFQLAGLQTGGGAAVLIVGGPLTQSGAVTSGSLDIYGTAGAIVLDNPANSVGTFGTVNNPGGDVTLVNAGTFSTGAITAGTGAAGDGNILLKSVSGDIDVNGNLTAVNDRVTLEARNGTFTLADGITIDANMLVYYVQTAPDFGVGTTIPTIIAANGDLTIGSLVSPTPITFGGYTTDGNITIIGTSVTITGLLQTTGLGKSIVLTATAGDIAFTGAGAIDNAPLLGGTTTLSAASGTVTGGINSAVSGGTTTVTAGQALSFTGPIGATTLAVTGAGQAVALTGANTLGTVSVANGGGSVVVNDSTGDLVIAGITGGTVTINAAGAVTQSAAINAGAFSVTGNGSAITLNTKTNTVTSFAASNGAGVVAFNDTAGGLDLAGITGGTVTIGAAGAVTQSAAVNAGAFSVNGNGSAITLNTKANTVTSFAANNVSGTVAFNDTTGGLDLAGITGGTVTISAAGAVTQTAAINAGAFSVNGNGSAITLNTQANNVTSFAAGNGVGSVLFSDTAGGLSLAGITGGTVTIGAAGAVTQSAAINASTLSVNGNGSAITLTGANTVASFAASNGAGSVTFSDAAGDLSLGAITAGPLTISAAGAVTINQAVVAASGNVVITTQSGGGLNVVGPQPGGLLQSTTQINLAGVRGPIALINGGLIVAPSIVGNGQNIAVGGNITTTPELNTAVAAINTLPIIAGSTYEILIGANLTLSQTLTMTRPVAMRGNGQVFTLAAGTGVTSGLAITSTAAGSRISSLAFSGFSGTGIQVNAARNVAISGITVIGTGTGVGAGLEISGASNGTTVQGSTFTNSPFGLKLTSATGVTFGGTLAGQRNTISGAARAGVFASGFCTGSSVIKTVFPRTPATPVPYNTRSSRNLRVVQ